MDKNNLKDIYNAIQNADKIGIAIHINPDGDALGSIIAMMLLCKQLSKKVVMYAPPFDNRSWKTFDGIEKLAKPFNPDDSIELMIILDCGNQSRVLDYDIIRNNVKTIINIDHHADNNKFGDINWTGPFSSVGEMIYLFLSEFNLDLSNEIAKALYISIYMDTGGFRHANTSADTLRVTANLVETGINSNKIISELRNTRTKLGIITLGNVLLKAKSTKDNKIVWTTKNPNECKSEIAPMPILREIKGAKIAIVFSEEKPNIFKISFRSVGNANVQQIAKHFGGGGHLAAAGVTIEGTEKKVVKEVIDYARKSLS